MLLKNDQKSKLNEQKQCNLFVNAIGMIVFGSI